MKPTEIVDWFIPQEVRDDITAFSKARIIVGFSLFLSALFCLTVFGDLQVIPPRSVLQ